MGTRDDGFLYPHTMGSVACYSEFLSSPHQQCIQSVSSFDHQGEDPLGKRQCQGTTRDKLVTESYTGIAPGLIQDQETTALLTEETDQMHATPAPSTLHTGKAISLLCCALHSRTGCCLYFGSFLFRFIIYILIYLFFPFPSNFNNIRWRV